MKLLVIIFQSIRGEKSIWEREKAGESLGEVEFLT